MTDTLNYNHTHPRSAPCGFECPADHPSDGDPEKHVFTEQPPSETKAKAIEQERIEAALDALAEITKMSNEEIAEAGNLYEKRSAAEEILRHYREKEMVKNIVVTINGAVPVRPMIRTEMES